MLARLPEPWRSLAARRRYLPSNVPILKRVAASQGDLVCARGDQIRVNQAPPMKRQAHDRLGRALDGWGGCRRLGPDEYLLLMSSPDSFDGRYFGPTPGGEIVGTARPLWTW